MGQHWGCLCGSSHLWAPGGVQKGFVWWFSACVGRLLQRVEVFGGCCPMVFLCLLDDFWILFLSWFATVCPCVPKGWLFPACFENCDILLGIIRVTLALPNAKSLFAIEFLTQKWHESKTKGQGGPAAHRFLGISCSNFKPWNWWDMGLHKLWPKTFTQVSQQFQAIKPSHFEDHDIYPIGSMYGIYANIWGILMVNITIYSIHGSYGYWFRKLHPGSLPGGLQLRPSGLLLSFSLARWIRGIDNRLFRLATLCSAAEGGPTIPAELHFWWWPGVEFHGLWPLGLWLGEVPRAGLWRVSVVVCFVPKFGSFHLALPWRMWFYQSFFVVLDTSISSMQCFIHLDSKKLSLAAQYTKPNFTQPGSSQVWMVQINGVSIVIMLEVSVARAFSTTCFTRQIPCFGPPWRLSPGRSAPWASWWTAAAGCTRTRSGCGDFPRCQGPVMTLWEKESVRRGRGAGKWRRCVPSFFCENAFLVAVGCGMAAGEGDTLL